MRLTQHAGLAVWGVCIALAGSAGAQQEFNFDGDTFTNAPFPNGTQTQRRKVIVERYDPTIWVDPDGCEHWVMDDGFEGFMTNHLDRDGKPVCRRATACASFPGDAMFATGQATLSAQARAQVVAFFESDRDVRSYVVTGHTDSRASDRYNLALSRARANAVANVARELGVQITTVQGAGERQPKATNATAQGRATNRRVDIKCVR